MAAQGIQVNAICPDFLQSGMFDQIRVHADILGVPFEKGAAIARVPLNRALQPGEIAQLAVYLGSGESDDMTEQSLLRDGGMLLV